MAACLLRRELVLVPYSHPRQFSAIGKAVLRRDTMSERLMDGFPPRPDTQVTLANWRTAPFNQWAFHHVRELLPTADIPHAPTNPRELATKSASLERLQIAGADGKKLTLDQTLKITSTDGLVVLHRGSIVLERYFNGMTEHSPHI